MIPDLIFIPSGVLVLWFTVWAIIASRPPRSETPHLAGGRVWINECTFSPGVLRGMVEQGQGFAGQVEFLPDGSVKLTGTLIRSQ